MRMVHSLSGLVTICLALVSLSSAAELTASTTDEGVLIRDGDAPVLFYQRRPKSQAGQQTRADYIHPLYGLDGEILTEDFPTDHLHHRGIFTAWHQLLFEGASAGDPWTLQDVEYDVRSVNVRLSTDGQLVLATLAWTRSQTVLDQAGSSLPLLETNQTIHIHSLRDGIRRIDFEIAVRALQPGVQIGGAENVKGYGGFSFRLRLPSDVAFNSQQGQVQPTTGPLAVGPWVALTGGYAAEARAAGVVVLCHPQTPGKPRQWILRRAGSMQNHAYPGHQAIRLSMTEPLLLRYRLLVHRGRLQPAQIETWYREYANQ